jgi:hypothetical protein
MCVFLTFIVPTLLHASDHGDRFQVGKGIVVSEDESVGDLVCVGCSIRVEGTCNDVVAVGGSVTVNGTVKGDLAVVGGGVNLGENSTVNGDVTTIGGRLSRHPNSVVKGSITSHSGAPIFFGLFLVPLIPVIVIVGLIVWLLSPSRRNTPARV